MIEDNIVLKLRAERQRLENMLKEAPKRIKAIDGLFRAYGSRMTRSPTPSRRNPIGDSPTAPRRALG